MNSKPSDEMSNIYLQNEFAKAQDLQSAGVDMEKSWSTVGDNNDCDLCKQNEKAGWIPLNKAFPSGHQFPLGHNGCRCDLRVRIKKESNEAKPAPAPTPAPAAKPIPPKRPWPRKAINILLIVIAASCLICVAVGWITDTLSPTPSITPSTTPQSNALAPVIQFTHVPAFDPMDATIEKYMQEYSGNPDVYKRIFTLTDCAELQKEFDQADANLKLQSPGTPQYKWSIGYMAASDDRMKAIACYP